MTALKFVLAFAFATYAACTKINLPTDYSTVTSGTRANLKANFDEIDSRSDACFDSTDEVRGRLSGYTGDFTISSMDNLRLRLDLDGSATSKFVLLTSNLDSIFRVSEDSSAKVFGALAVAGRTTLSDSLIAISARWTGNLSAVNGAYSGTLGVTGNLTNTVLAGTGTRLVTSTSVGLLGNSTSITGQNEFTALQAFGAGINISGNGTSATATIYRTASDGLLIRGVTGSSNDLVLESASGSDILRNTTGTTATDFPGSGVTVSGTLGVAGVQTNSEAIVFGANGTGGTGRIYKHASYGLVMRGIAGSTNDLALYSVAGNELFANPTGTNNLTVGYSSGGVTIPGTATTTGVHTFTAAPVFTAATASQAMFTNGSKALVSNAITGTGNVVMSASPTMTGTIGAASQTLSGTLGVTGVATFTAAPVFSSVTASQILSVDGSKGLTSTATTGTGSVMLAASPTTTGTLTAAAISASGNVTADSLISSKFYAEGTFTATATGMTTSPTGTVSYVRVGKMVTLVLPVITGTSNATSFSYTGLPAGLTPATIQLVSLGNTIAYDNGTLSNVPIHAYIHTSLGIRFYINANASGWTASGTKRIDVIQTITYTLQ